MALSPDGKKVLFSIFNLARDAGDLWLMDVERGVPTRNTFRPGISADGIWSPDGNMIAFQSDNMMMYRKPANGTGKEELLTALLTDALAESDAAIFASDSQHQCR